MKNRIAWMIATVALMLTIGTKPVAAEQVVLTFEGLKSGEAVNNYYAGGKGSQGTGPGPNYGITFTGPVVDGQNDAIAYIPAKPFPNDPSPPTVLLLASEFSTIPPGQPISAYMNVSPGFSGFLGLYYAAVDTDASVQIYSGINGTGTLLASMKLPFTSTTTGIFDPNEIDVSFSGVARSAVFSGGNQQAAFDDIRLTTPEPASPVLLLIGGGCALIYRRFHREGRRNAPSVS